MAHETTECKQDQIQIHFILDFFQAAKFDPN